MESKEVLARPSTSQKSFHTRLEKQETDEDNIVAMRCLELIEKIASKLKSDTSGFVDILQKIHALMETNTINRDSKYDLIDKLMLNIMNADKEELISLKGDFKKIFCRREIKELLVDDRAIIRKECIGMGVFGIVHRAILRRPGETATEVTIKSAGEHGNKKMIENEASVLPQLNHKNIIKILAITKLESNVVMEYMDIGNLVLAVEKMNFTTLNLLKILNDVASGMEYLHGKKYIHRDLACNIVFLNSKKKCKIGNFGFCVYVGDTKGVYPEKVPNPLGYNISPETLISKKFTVETDVWAMGVLCWELFYLVEHANEIPCGELKLRVHLEKFQQINERFIKPKPCPRKLHAYITGQLLEMNPKARPPFTEMKGKLKEFISSS